MPWSAEEDEQLKQAVLEIGPKRWSAIAVAVPGRSGKQCRLRWCNQIDPNIRHDQWTEREDAIILRAHKARRIPSPPPPHTLLAATP